MKPKFKIRNLEFRVWDRIAKVMYYFPNDTWQSVAFDGTPWNNPNLIPMQAIGHKDKNKKKIFDGDIIFDRLSSDCFDKRMGIFTVEYNEEYSAFVLKRRDNTSWNWIRNVSSHGEVIGNIFESPKALDFKHEN